MKELLPILTRPCRYTGAEWGVESKDPSRVRVRLALAFPDLYDVGMSYMGQQILLHAVNARDEFWAERVYAPCEETAEIMRREDVPLATLESDTPIRDMDAVAFSLTHELCYTNILYMLDLSGIPLRAGDRDDSHPLVLAGGGAGFNAEPVADFLDAVVIGDGEEALPEILEHIDKARELGLKKDELLKQLKRIPGVYIPAFFKDQGPGKPLLPVDPAYARVEKAIVQDLDLAPFPSNPMQTFGQAIHDRLTLEIARGCTRGCRFCQAGMIYRPVRERNLENLEKLLQDGLANTGFEELSLLSLSTGDYSALEALFTGSFDRCASEQVSISLPSLRVGSLSEPIIKRMASIRRTGATLAPEAGSQRLRDVINKGIHEQELLDHVLKLFENGWQMVKLYFMIGLPTETEEDLKAILDLCLKVRDVAGRHVKRLQITAAVSPFVPKPHTPFQWERQINLEEIRERIGLLRNLFRPHKRLTLKFHEPEMSYLEGVFSRGDRRLAPVVEDAYRSGALFTSWKDRFRIEPYLKALEKHGLSVDEYLAARDLDAPLPWDHLNCGVSRKYLLTERRRALEEKISNDCRYDACRNCGVCGFNGHVSTLEIQAATKDIRPRVVFKKRDQTEGDPAQEFPHHDDLHEKGGHYRIWYEKRDLAAYLSQLELQTAFGRAMRRAALPVSFSAGFHPLPRLSFGMALPVGVESLSEWVNVFLRRPMEPDEIREKLAPCLPAGLRLTRVETLTMGKKQSHPVSEIFFLEFKGARKEVQARLDKWRELMESDEFIVVRKTKRGMKEFNMRPLIKEASPRGSDGLRLVLDWSAGYLNPLVMVQKVNDPITGLDFSLLKLEQLF